MGVSAGWRHHIWKEQLIRDFSAGASASSEYLQLKSFAEQPKLDPVSIFAPWLEDLSSDKTFVLRKTSNHVFKPIPNSQKSNQDSQDISTLEEVKQG